MQPKLASPPKSCYVQPVPWIYVVNFSTTASEATPSESSADRSRSHRNAGLCTAVLVEGVAVSLPVDNAVDTPDDKGKKRGAASVGHEGDDSSTDSWIGKKTKK